MEKAARKYGPSTRNLVPLDSRDVREFRRNDGPWSGRASLQFVCTDPGCVAFDAPQRMHLVLPRPLAELGEDADDAIRHSVRCESCYMRKANALEGRALALYFDRTGTVQAALNHPRLAAALLGGDPMSPDARPKP